ncbi:CocE/NonD family hydrolase [Streptomyces canus]
MQHLYEIDVRVPMRDGVALAANVWHSAEGEAPTLLVRLPYGKDVMGFGQSAFPDLGEFVPHMADRVDGEDTVAWIADQPWSDGTVGMFGPSYLGMVQWETAVTGVPALKAIAPTFTSIDNYEASWFSAGGALPTSPPSSSTSSPTAKRSTCATESCAPATEAVSPRKN